MKRIILIGLIGLLLLIGGSWGLASVRAGITVEHSMVGSIPVTFFLPAKPAQGVMILAHGFAGSQQMLYPLATTLAQAGIPAVTFDFPGHGQHPQPFPAQNRAADDSLADTLAAVVAYAAELFPESSVMVAGHSMGSGVAVEYGRTHPEIAATVGISLVDSEVSLVAPKNLLIVTGAWEFERFKLNAQQALQQATTQQAPAPFTTIGDLQTGAARRLEWIPATEHISVLYAPAMLQSVTQWAQATLGQQTSTVATDRRILWVALIMLGGVLLLWAGLALINPLYPPTKARCIPGWKRVLVELVPAVLTPLLLSTISTTWMPLILAGYIAAFFLVYALLQWATARFTGIHLHLFAGVKSTPWTYLGLALGVTGWLIMIIGVPAQLAVLNVLPISARSFWMFVCMLFLMPYFLVDAAIARSGWGVLITRILFIGSLFVSTIIRTDVGFLLLILPLFGFFFALMGVVSSRLSVRSGRPFLAALVTATIFGWFLAVALPYTG